VDKEENTPPLAAYPGIREAKASPNQMDIREAVWHPSGTGLMLNATDHPNRIRTPSAFFSSVCGTPRMATERGRLHDPGPCSSRPIRQYSHRRDGQRMAFVAAVKTPHAPRPHPYRHGEKALRTHCASVDRQSLTSAGPRTADCSRCGGWISHEVPRFHSRRRVENLPAVPANPNASAFRFRRGCFAAQTATTPQNCVWTRRTLRSKCLT